MPAPRSDQTALMDVRVRNWARAYRGGIPDPTRQRGPRGMVDELDAARVEAAMVALRRSRPTYWPIVRARYLASWMDMTAAQRLRVSVRTYQRRVTGALLFLARRA